MYVFQCVCVNLGVAVIVCVFECMYVYVYNCVGVYLFNYNVCVCEIVRLKHVSHNLH